MSNSDPRQLPLDVNIDFTLFSEPQCKGAEVIRYKAELLSSSTQKLLESMAGQKGVYIKSAIIEKAEQGLVISFFRHCDSKTPSVTISFAIDIHEPVVLETLDHSYHKKNVDVNVFVSNPTEEPFKRVELCHSTPRLFVL